MSPAALPSVAVLGSGSWGTALASLIARNGHATTIWGRDADQVASIRDRHENTRYLPGIPLPDALAATTDLAAAVAGADLVLVVTPSHAFTETLHALAPHRRAAAGVAWATKGFEPGSGRFLHEVAGEVLGGGVPLAVVTGPSFAKEVALGRGQSIGEAVAGIGQVVESVQTADEVIRLGDRHEVDLPIDALVQAVLHERISPAEGVKLLLSREQKPEYPDGLFGD